MTDARLGVWVTRTRPGAEATAARVERAGFTAVVSPLLEVRALEVREMDEGDVAFTSRNGVRYFRGSLDRTAWCVGEGTAAEARGLGFRDVRVGPGDVAGLSKMIRAEMMVSEVERAVVHWAGAHVRGDLVGELRRAGHVAERVVAYRAEAVEEIGVGEVDVVMLHSPRAAEVYAARAKGVARASVAISAAADAPLAADAGLVRYVAETPDEGGMLAALVRAAGELTDG